MYVLYKCTHTSHINRVLGVMRETRFRVLQAAILTCVCRSAPEDVYGVNSLGESLRFVLSGFGGRQVLVVVWHPSVLKATSTWHF